MGLIPAHRFYLTGLMQRLAIAANRRPSQAENFSAQLALAVNPAYGPWHERVWSRGSLQEPGKQTRGAW